MTISIIDSASINGLLKMAGDEGMLEDREDHGDKLLFSLNKQQLPNWHKHQILEQVILNDKVYSVRDIPFDWLRGEFLEMGLIEMSKVENENLNMVEKVSPELIEGMLLARGYDADLDRWHTILKVGIDAADEINEYERLNPGIKIDSFSNLIRGTIDKKFKNSKQYKLASKWNKAVLDAKPITNVIEELLLLSSHAKVQECYLKVPVFSQSDSLVSIPSNEPPITGEVTQIYRITTQKLGSIPVLDSLQSALLLAKQPETIALRAKITEWVKSIDNSSVDVTTKIQNEINKAASNLTKASRLKSTGFITGIISIPVSAIGIVNPFLGALGLSLTCIGVVFDRVGTSIEKSVNWIGFGSYRS